MATAVKDLKGISDDIVEALKPENLYAKLIETNDSANLTTRPPTAAQVEDWIAQAKVLPKTLTY